MVLTPSNRQVVVVVVVVEGLLLEVAVVVVAVVIFAVRVAAWSEVREGRQGAAVREDPNITTK